MKSMETGAAAVAEKHLEEREAARAGAGADAADTIRRLFYQSIEAAAKANAEAMTQELINGTAKMFGVPFGLVLDGARAADAWVESMEKVEEAGRKKLLEERDRFLAELEAKAGKLIPAEPKKGVE